MLDIENIINIEKQDGTSSMGVWQGVAMDSLEFHPDLVWITLLRPAGRPPLKQPVSGLPLKRPFQG
jgi:hypothetical protein